MHTDCWIGDADTPFSSVIFNKSRQYGIRQNGIGNLGFGKMGFGNLVLIHLAILKIINNLADKISVSANKKKNK
jgi:hypothetical protein